MATAATPVPDADALERSEFANEVSAGVVAGLDPTLKQIGEALGGIQEILAAQKAPAVIADRANPMADAWKDSEMPATASLYTPPAPGEEGVRLARVMRALACGKHFNEVPRILSDKFNDKSTARLMEKSLATTTPSEGGALVVDQFLVSEFFPVLRAGWDLAEAGARNIPMPTGSVTIPGMTAGASFGWVDETESPTPSTPGFGSVHLTAKKARAKVIISNDLREQASVDVDRMVLDDMVLAVREGLTRAFLVNSGSQKSPQGVKFNNRRTQVDIGAVTPDSPTAFIKALMAAKVGVQPGFAHIFNQDLWAFLYNLKTNTGDYHFREEMDKMKLAGFRFFTTPMIDTTANVTDWFFGDWRELLIGDTKSMEIKINPYSQMDADSTELHLFHKTDCGLRQGKAIAHADDCDIS